MTDISPESIEDPEVPIEDAIEQHEPLPGGDDRDQDEEPDGFELPDEANPADVAEQHQDVQATEDEDTYR